MKKIIPIVLVVALVLGGGIFAVVKIMQKPAPTATPIQKKKITDPVNIIDVADRPYVQIIPKDVHNIAIAINDLKKPATSVDYEIEYQTGTSLEGAVGAFPVNTTPTVDKNILLGSCSAGGACRYHEDVQGGTLLTKYSGGPESYALKSEWHYIDNKSSVTAMESKDAKFQVESPDLAQQRIVIIFNSPGYPKGLSGTVVSDPYTLDGLVALKGNGKITMRANTDVTKASIMGWNGSAWTEFPATVDSKTATADNVSLMQLYILVKK